MKMIRFGIVIGILLISVSCGTVLPEVEEAEPVAPSDPEAPVVEEASPTGDVLSRYMATLSREQKVGQLLMPALQSDSGVWATVVGAATYDLLQRYPVGGFILYTPNISSAEQLQRLTSDLQSSSDIPLTFSIDLEGGKVNRLRSLDWGDFDLLPGAETVGRVTNTNRVQELYALVGSELRALGITMNMAPVADVLSNSRNYLIGSRSFGSDADTVSAMVEAAVKGFQSANISAVIKHFPGHGSTARDSHSEALASGVEMDQFQEDLEPFQTGLDAGVDAVMVNHVSYPEVVDDNLPSSLSAVMISDVLRSRMGFQGVVITDSLRMKGVLDNYTPEEVAVMAIDAGADVLLRPQNVDATYNALLDAIDDGLISQARLDESVYRVLKLKQKRGILRIADDLSVELAIHASELPDYSDEIRDLARKLRVR